MYTFTSLTLRGEMDKHELLKWLTDHSYQPIVSFPDEYETSSESFGNELDFMEITFSVFGPTPNQVQIVITPKVSGVWSTDPAQKLGVKDLTQLFKNGYQITSNDVRSCYVDKDGEIT